MDAAGDHSELLASRLGPDGVTSGFVVTVVVVTWNAAALVATCLDSLENQTLPRRAYQVVLVDNASEDATVDQVKGRFPLVHLVSSDRNLGFAGGANLGLRATTTPYVVLLNNDAIADPQLLTTLVDAFDAPGADRVAAVTARVRLAGTELLNSTGNLVSRTGRGRDRDWMQPDDGSRAAGQVFGFCGAAVALRRSALDEVGLFDDDLFLYYEDTDLSWRLRAGGWTIRYEPRAEATHRHASSSQAGSPRFHYWNERNSMIVFTRHAPLALVLALHVRRPLGLLLHTLRAPGSPETAARWRAARDHVRRLPTTLRERRALWAGARVPRAVVGRFLDRSAT